MPEQGPPPSLDRREAEDVRLDAAVARIAARQAGAIATAQLAAVGIDKDGIAWRVATGRLHRAFRGAYFVGHPNATAEGWAWAAWLSAGPEAVVSHLSAAHRRGLTRNAPESVHLIVPTDRKSRPGLTFHKANLEPHEVTRVRGLPTTTAARTLHDLQPTLPLDELETLVNQALITRSATRVELDRQARLRHVLTDGYTRSKAERLLAKLAREARLPPLVTNARLAGFEIDAYFPGHRVAVEVDSKRFHGTPVALERDARKTLLLRAQGIDLVRVTWRLCRQEPLLVVATMARAIGRAEASTAWPRSPS